MGKNHFGGKRKISRNARKTQSTFRRTASRKLNLAMAQIRRKRKRDISTKNGRQNPISAQIPPAVNSRSYQSSSGVATVGGAVCWSERRVLSAPESGFS